MKLYHYPISPNSRKVLALLHHFGLACELAVVEIFKGEQMQPAFLKLNPNHMIPTLVDGDFVLWESNAILQYLCTKVPGNSLWPTGDPARQADISRWQFWQSGHFGAACGILIYERLIKKVLNLGAPDPVEIAKGAERFNRFAKILEDHLKGREWLVGDSLTLADLSVGSFLDLADLAEYPVKPYGEITRWYRNLEQLPAWQSSAPPK